MEILIDFLEEVIRFFVILEELYHAWKVSPHLYVTMFGKALFVIIITMAVLVMFGSLKNLSKGRRNKR